MSSRLTLGPRISSPQHIGLALLWIAVAVAFFASKPGPPPSPPAALPRQLELVAGDAPVVALLTAPDGDVWVVTRDTAVRYADADPSRPQVVLDPSSHREHFHRALDPLVAAHVDARGALWLGSRRGDLLVFEDGTWRERWGRGPVGPIRAIATHGDAVYVAGRGLWRGALRGGPLVPQTPFADVRIEHLVSDSTYGLAFAAGDRVWVSSDGGWRSLWRTEAGDGAIDALASGPRGEIWIGTRNGLVRVAPDGSVRRELEQEGVEALGLGPAAVLAATSRSGLLTRYAGDWRRVDSPNDLERTQVSAIAVAPGGAFWLALQRRGVFRAGPPAAAGFATRD